MINTPTCKKCGKNAEFISDSGLDYFCQDCFKERNVRMSDDNYWKNLANGSRSDNDGQLKEDALANPDVLSEADGMFDRPLSEEGEIQLEVINSVMETLSPQQRRVFQHLAYEGRTIDEVASLLKLDRSTVYTLFQRAKKKILKEYKQLDD